MNIDSPHPSASPVGRENASFLGQHNEQALRGENKNNKTSNTGDSKEGIVQKLQEVLFTVRRDRDREHRSSDIAFEKLRSAKDILEGEKSNLEAEREKLMKTRNEAENAEKEISREEATIQQLKAKVQPKQGSSSNFLIRNFSRSFYVLLTLLRNCILSWGLLE